MKRALLVLAHGSPRAEANAPLFQALERLRDTGRFPIVEVGFLECNEPDIPAAIRECVDLGADEVVAIPYFLHTGTHVSEDLPRFLKEAAERWPGVQFRLAPFLGRSPLLADILAARAESALR